MSIYQKQVKNLADIPVYIQTVDPETKEIKEIPVTVKNVLLSILNDYRPANMLEMSICLSAIRKIQKEDENLDEDEIKKIIDLLLSSKGLALYTVKFVLDALSEKYEIAQTYIEEKLGKEKEKTKEKEISTETKEG